MKQIRDLWKDNLWSITFSGKSLSGFLIVIQWTSSCSLLCVLIKPLSKQYIQFLLASFPSPVGTYIWDYMCSLSHLQTNDTYLYAPLIGL